MRDEQAGHPGTDDGAHLEDHLGVGEGGNKEAGIYEERDRGVAGRVGESGEAGGHRTDEVEGPDRGMVRERVESEANARAHESERREEDEQPTVDRVADRPADEREHDHRDELDNADESDL